jgi:putative ABC transport system substrate-binding protein
MNTGQAIDFSGPGYVEGQNLSVDRYSGKGRPEGYADLARDVVNRNPDVIVASTDAITRAVRAATDTIPIVWIGGDPIEVGFATSLAHPGKNITGVTVNAGDEIWRKRLQILKEAVPSASKVAYLTTLTNTVSPERQFQEILQRLQTSVTSIALQELTPSGVQRAFAEIGRERFDAIIVESIGDLLPYRQLNVDLVEKNRLPAMYPWRDYIAVGGLMAYASDDRELWRRMADDVHQILNGMKPGNIPIYQSTKFDLVINLKAAKALRLTIPPSLLGVADEVLE